MQPEPLGFRTFGDILAEAFDADSLVPEVGVAFPFLPPGRRGLKPGELVTLAGPASSGKTALALGLADHIAVGKEARPVGFFALADSIENLAMRLIAQHAQVSSASLRYRGNVQWQGTQVKRALEELKSAPLNISELTDFSVHSVVKRAELARQRGHLDLLLIDYIQLLENPSSSYDSWIDAFASVVRELKYAAKHLSVPVVVVSTMEEVSRDLPTLSNLGVPDVLAEHSDLVMLVHRPEPWSPDLPLEPAQVIIAKDRSGPTCQFDTQWIPELATFADLVAA